MNVSYELLSAWQAADEKTREKYEKLWDDYEAACLLAEGPLKDRSAHWKVRRADLARQVRQALGLNRLDGPNLGRPAPETVA